MLKRFSKLLKTAMAKFSISKEGVWYTRYYKSINVDNSVLLIDNCMSISDNPQMLKELCNNKNYKALKKYMTASDVKSAKFNSNIETVKPFSKKHLKLLAGAKYIISDELPNFYIKKEQQVYINIGSGVNIHNLSSQQRNCLISSYIACQNQQEFDLIKDRFMLGNLFNGIYLITQNPLDALSFAMNGEQNGVIAVDGNSCSNNRKNVLIFTGALDKNGITTALKNLMNYVGTERNYIPFFYEKAVMPNRESINDLGGKDYICVSGDMDMTLTETIVLALYFLNIAPLRIIQKMLDGIYEREIKRCFGSARFDYVIHFTGYARNVFQLISRLDAKKFVWVHNNMFLEAKTKGNVHISTIKYGYEKCDKIVVVRDTMRQELTEYVGSQQRNKIAVVHNINDIDLTVKKSLMPVEFQGDTYCSVSLDELNRILENKKINKFINIARFSKEKGAERLLSAFDKYRAECDEDAYLIIIGGYGEEFEHIKAIVDDMQNIILIKSIMNPYPILAKCDLFVLSSYYEGLPMTIIEALMLDVSVISTDITGPREFLSTGYGRLVEDSEQGLIDGMKEFNKTRLSGSVKFDAEEFNRVALEEFNMLFK